MLRINTVSLCLSGVLAFGLPSVLTGCGKAEDPAVKRDVYKAPAPRLNKNGQSVDLNGWDRSSQRTLDIHDGVDVRGSGAAQVEIAATCRRGDADSHRTITTNEQNLIPLLQFLPEDLLVADLSEKDAICGFKITLLNSNNSRHIFSIDNATIRDAQQPTASLEQNGRKLTEPRVRLSQGALNGINFRAPLPGSSAAVICRDARSPQLAVGAVGGISEFDLNGMIPREGRLDNVLETNAKQLCRIAFAVNGLNQAITPLFELQLSLAPLRLTAGPQDHRSSAGYDFDPTADSVLRGGSVQLMTFLVENPSASARTVRLAKQALNTQLYIYMGNRTERTQTITRRFIAVEPGGGVIGDSASHWKLSVPAQSQLQINVSFRPPTGLHCNDPDSTPFPPAGLPNFALDFLESFKVEEVGDNNQVIATMNADLGPRFYQNISDALIKKYQPAQVPNLCGW